MDREHKLIFNDSFQTCYADPQFIQRFYQLFIASSEDIQQKFANTDMAVQIRMMKKSLAYMMLVNSNPDPIRDTAKRHDKAHLDIKPKFYDYWMEAMIEAVKVTDPKFSAKTESAWRESLKPGIDLMLKSYHSS